tara:strand:+ start:71 stop:331 length:261 start_codon:yes stop_codon:yes gene_type:complete
MNIDENFSSPDNNPSSNDVMATAMNEIATILIEPMEKAGKITEEQNAILALIGLSFKIMAEKATQLEKLEEGFQGNFINEGDFNRN